MGAVSEAVTTYPATVRGRGRRVRAGVPLSELEIDRTLDELARIRQTRSRVSVIIPTLNEAENLPHVFARMPFEQLFEVIIVDGHSVDDTVEVARTLRPSVRVVLQDGVGKGNALARGFAAARGEIIVMLDADGSTDPQEIPRYLESLFDGADFAKGSRFIEGGGSADITPIRRLGNALLRGIANLLFGTRYTDLCYGYNAFWARVLPELDVTCDGFEVETLLNVRAAKAGLNVAEVPSIEGARISGRSNLRPVRDGLRVLRTILVERLRRGARDGRLRPTDAGHGAANAGAVVSSSLWGSAVESNPAPSTMRG